MVAIWIRIQFWVVNEMRFELDLEVRSVLNWIWKFVRFLVVNEMRFELDLDSKWIWN